MAWAFESKRRESWSHTSNLLAMLFNCNRDPKTTKAASANDFNPFVKHAKSAPGKLSITVLRDVFVDKPSEDPGRLVGGGTMPIGGPSRIIGPERTLP